MISNHRRISTSSQISDASMHLADVEAKAQESEDPDMLAWHAFYNAIVNSKSTPSSVCPSLAQAVCSKRVSEEDDAKLLFHSFVFMADHFARFHADPRICSIAPTLERPRVIAAGHAASANPNLQTVDRLWNLLRTPQLSNPFALNSAARRMLAGYSGEVDASSNQVIDSNIAFESDMGLKFVSSHLVGVNSGSIPDPFVNYLNREKLDVRPDDGSVHGELETCLTTLDQLLDCPSLPVAAILSTVAHALAISVPLQLSIFTVRILLRLAQLRIRTHSLVEATLILDDIEGPVFSNCTHFDAGRFFEIKADCLIAISEKVHLYSVEGQIDLLCDALKAIQTAIVAYDRSHAIDGLLNCTLTAAVVSQKLKVESLCTFYAVKYQQITAADSDTGRFFPTDTDSVLETGQPKLPSELTHSPKAVKKDMMSPLSPAGRGRGLQTLITWRSNSSN